MSNYKSAHINIRLTEEDHTAIVHRAKQAGFGISEYVRRVMLKDDDDQPIIRVDTEILKKLYRDFRLAGSNLNQIAREINTHHRPYELEEELAVAFETVSNASNAVAQFLVEARNNV